MLVPLHKALDTSSPLFHALAGNQIPCGSVTQGSPTSPYLILLLLLDATWSIKQNISGTLPKAKALPATPAMEFFLRAFANH